MRGLLAVVLVSAMVLAGCSGGDDAAADAGVGASGSASGTATGPAPIDFTNVSLLNPAWTVGQSWEWSLSSQVLRVALTTTTTVLAAEAGAYDVGVDALQPMIGIYPFHLIATGPVDAATLAWQAHGLDVQLLRFPLQDGDTFTTDLWGAPGATVLVEAANVTGLAGLEPGFRSTASYAGGGTFLQADYAPSLGQFVRVASYFGDTAPFAEATLVGVADTPTEPVGFRVTDLGRLAAAGGDPTALTPVQTTVPADADLALLACFMGGATGPASAQLAGGGVSALCAYEPNSGFLPPYNWALSNVEAGPATLSGQVAAGSAVFEAFAIDTTV